MVYVFEEFKKFKSKILAGNMVAGLCDQDYLGVLVMDDFDSFLLSIPPLKIADEVYEEETEQEDESWDSKEQ